MGQLQQPVFSNKADSILYADLNKSMMDVATGGGPRRQAMLDSIGKLINEHSKKIVRYRWVYRPSNDHKPYGGIHHSDLSTVYKLAIVRHNGNKLPDSLFLLTNLQSLELIDCRMSRLPRRLASLPQLRSVTLYNNSPKRRLKLSKNNNVARLTISGEDGRQLPKHYRKLTGLTELNLMRNGLTAFPDLRGCNSLKTLNLAYNQLTLDDLKPEQPASVEAINLGNNAIVRVPDAIASFKGLVRLNFPNNKIEQVGAGIGQLSNLEHLSFYKNSLGEIPPAIFELKNLKVIDLYHNRISVVDSKIGQWRNLEILYLANNNIHSLPSTLTSLTGLTELYLHHNKLSTTPPGIGNLTNLQILRVNNNAILEFDIAIAGLKKLRNLDLSANELRALPVESLDFPQLELLSLHTNPWNTETRRKLETWAEQLRKRDVVVHLNAQRLFEMDETQ